MGDIRGFLNHDRKLPTRRPVPVRLLDWNEVYEPFPTEELQSQASRCMNCGIPFCNNGCPLGNIIPDWNDLVYRDRWRDAIERLHATNNFPEFTGRLCPAPCEAACVLGINQDPVTIKQVEVTIIERAFEEGWVTPQVPPQRTGKRVAVVGSGPAGLAAAQQLTRAGHDVVVYERADRIGGLLRYGIPNFKMEKRILDRRLDQMRAEGTEFRVNANVGGNVEPAELDGYDAVVLAGGATAARDLPIPGRELDGIHQAMEFLPQANRVTEGDAVPDQIRADGKRVVIIGGGDTGADCLGTAHRHGALSVHSFEIMPQPPESRDGVGNPWPTWPNIFRTASAHEEGGERWYSVTTTEFVGDEQGHVTALRGHQVELRMEDGRPTFAEVPGTAFELEADLVLLALGFTGPERGAMLDHLGVGYDPRGNVERDGGWRTANEKVFCCGDMGRGQSLIVWAIAEGRSCAAAVDRYLMGDTLLPTPVEPTTMALR
ncbi:MAG: glutamate synthase subunit beta [Acidimicrobiia bacterium]